MTLPTYEQALATARERQPFSNGTELYCWLENHCDTCIYDKAAREGRPEDGCVLIVVAALDMRTPAEWTEDKPGYLGEQWRCIHFRDEDDGGDPEPKPIPDPPGQLTLAPREPFERPARMLTPLEQPVEAAQ